MLNLAQTAMVIQTPNGSIYHCAFDEGEMDSHPILFSPEVRDPNQHGSTCEFEPVNVLCEVDLRSFSTSTRLVKLDSTYGAYRCKTPTSSGLASCQNNFTGFRKFSNWAAGMSIGSAVLAAIHVVIFLVEWAKTACPCCKKYCSCSRCSPESTPLFPDGGPWM